MDKCYNKRITEAAKFLALVCKVTELNSR